MTADKTLANQGSTNQRRFAIALSFPGEDRDFAEELANALADRVGRDRVFYDEWYEAELVGVDGDVKLRTVYRDHAELIVPIFSEHYGKPWCTAEWSTIRAILLERRADDSVIPVQLDDTTIPGWEAIDFAILRRGRTTSQLADLILEAHDSRRTPGDKRKKRAVPGSRSRARTIWGALVVAGIALGMWFRVPKRDPWLIVPDVNTLDMIGRAANAREASALPALYQIRLPQSAAWTPFDRRGVSVCAGSLALLPKRIEAVHREWVAARPVAPSGPPRAIESCPGDRGSEVLLEVRVFNAKTDNYRKCERELILTIQDFVELDVSPCS